jgi:oxygen-independent coproporphyrinogen-3 oxidase
VGFGADAHSFDGATRSHNGESMEDYLAGLGRDSEPAVADERLFIGLRLTQGIRPHPAEWRRFEQPIRRFLETGLLETDGDRLRLTSRGVLLSNEVFQEFLAP